MVVYLYLHVLQTASGACAREGHSREPLRSESPGPALDPRAGGGAPLIASFVRDDDAETPKAEKKKQCCSLGASSCCTASSGVPSVTLATVPALRHQQPPACCTCYDVCRDCFGFWQQWGGGEDATVAAASVAEHPERATPSRPP